MITRELLNRLLEGRCSPGELEMLREYFDGRDTGDLKDILDEDWQHAEPGIAEELTHAHKQRILVRLKGNIASNRELDSGIQLVGSRRKMSLPRRIVAAVASICILASASYFLWFKPLSGETALLGVDDAFITQENSKGVPETVFLPDGSKAILDPGSTLRFPRSFTGRERPVELTGKAFFDVVADSLSPFFVRTSSLNVRVLGTSFNVSAFENSAAEVSVVTGKVSVFVKEEKEAVTLEPNERVVRAEKSIALEKTLVEIPVILRSEELLGMFDFDEASVADVFEALERAYDIKIRFDRPLVEGCTLKARLDDQPLFVKLDMICASLGLEYEIVGTDILITGEGCQS